MRHLNIVKNKLNLAPTKLKHSGVTWNSSDSLKRFFKCQLSPLLPSPQGASAPLRPLPLLRATWSRWVRHVYLSWAWTAGQPPPLHHGEAGLCQLGTDFWHPLLSAGLEPSATPSQPNAGVDGNSGAFGTPEDVTGVRWRKCFRDSSQKAWWWENICI